MSMFDFNKKEEVVVEEKSGVFSKKKIPSIPKVINVNISFGSLPKGVWAILVAAISLFCMNDHVPDAGWGLFLAFLLLDNKKALIPFLLAALGLMGMHEHIEGAGWLLFFAFFCS